MTQFATNLNFDHSMGKVLKLVFGTILLLLSLGGYTQITLSGVVLDQQSKEYLVGATVSTLPSEAGTTTDVNGLFFLQLASLPDTLVVSYLGYASDTLLREEIQLKALATIYLEPASTQIVAVTVREKRLERPVATSLISLRGTDAYLIPAFLGTPDLFKFLQTKPGILIAGEGSSNLVIRGGSPDQNLILLDGNPIYYPNHLGGFISIFNNDAIANLQVFKGYQPARYGDRLSSVIDITTTRNQVDRWKYSYELGPIISKIQLSVPIKKNTTSLFVSAQRSLLDVIYRAVQGLSGGTDLTTYGLGDINLKLNTQIGKKGVLSYGTYWSQDRLLLAFEAEEEEGQFDSRTTVRWSNLVNHLNYRHVGNSYTWNTSVGWSRFRYTTESIDEFLGQEAEDFRRDELRIGSGITDIYAKIHFNKYQAWGNWQVGVQHNTHRYLPQNSFISTTSASRNSETQIFAHELITFVQATSKWRAWRFDLGLRLPYFITENFRRIYPQPRLNILRETGERSNWSISVSKMVQFSHLLSTNGAGLPTDIWVPATSEVPPAESWQYDTGFSLTSQNRRHRLGIGLFYKTMEHLIAYRDGISIRSGRNYQELITGEGVGQAYGLELEYQWSTPKNDLNLSYTLSRSFRTFTDINNGDSYPYRYDRPHALNIVYNRTLKPHLQLDMLFTLYSGEAVSLATQSYDINVFDSGLDRFALSPSYGPHSAHLLEGRNSFRSPLYHRQDWQLTYRKDKEKHTRFLRFGITNTYNRVNSYFLFYNRDRATGTNTLNRFGLFPMLPFVSYSVVSK